MRKESTLEKEIASPYAITKLDYQAIPQLSEKDKKYIREDESLRPFYKYSPTLDSFGQVFSDKKFSKEKRETLVSVLKKQYKKIGVEKSESVWDSIDALEEENTFTVITAHQPSLFTGPLYYVIKIFSAINLANQLNEKYPNKKVIPVFITGGEDHDFEEVNHLNIFGKTINWENTEKGSVGMMNTKTLDEPLAQLFDILGDSENAETLKKVIGGAHKKFEKYSEAVTSMVHEFFGKYGLVVLDMNNPELKRQFSPILKDELEHQSSGKIVRKTIKELEAVDYPNQAFPRDINLFYLKDQMRNRIEIENDVYKIVDTDLRFSKKEMSNELENHPERFSPNVIMRPIYQEFSLPNLAYIGGGGEIAYWLERQSQFNHYNLNFPMLIRRNSMLWIDEGSNKKLAKFEFPIPKIFESTDSLIKKMVIEISDQTLKLNEEIAKIEGIFKGILSKITSIDKGLEKYVLAEKTKQIKVLKNIESKIIRAEKQKNESSVNQVRKLREKLFPKDGLQERHDNFIPFYLKYGESFFETLKNELDPMDRRFTIISGS